MDGKLLFCISVIAGENTLYGPEWKEAEPGKTLIDLFLQVCGTKVIGQQVQVLVSKDRSFLEAAVVQVCSPLIQLSDKNQSYIQFILKCDAGFPKNSSTPAFQCQRGGKTKSTFKGRQSIISPVNLKDTLHNQLHNKDTHTHTFVDWKDSMDSDFPSFSASHMEPPLRHYSTFNMEQTPLHSLTTKPSFENMTVEEICEEIKRIKSNEISKTKVSPWIDPTITSKSKESSLKDTPIKKQSPVTTDRAAKKVSPPKRTIVAGKSKTVTKRTESAKNKINVAKSKPSPPPSSSPSPRSTTSSSNISDRLSVLAQPRRRMSTSNTLSTPTPPPIKRSSSRKSLQESTKAKFSAKRNNASPSMTRGSRVNSTFVKTGVKITTKTKGNEKSADTTSSEYFVEIFSKDKKDIAKVLNRAKDMDNHIKRLPDYSTDSLTNQSVDKSYESEKSSGNLPACESDDFSSKDGNVSMSDMLSKVRNDRLENQNLSFISTQEYTESPVYPPPSSENLTTLPTPEFLLSNELGSSPDEAVIFDKNKTCSENQNSDDGNDDGEEENNKDSSLEKMKRIAKDILSNNSSISIEHALDDYLSSSPQTSPAKALFSPLFERNNLRHISSTPIIPCQNLRSKSVDNINLELFPDLKNASKNHVKNDKGLSKSLDSLDENKVFDMSADERMNKTHCGENIVSVDQTSTGNSDIASKCDCVEIKEESENISWSNSRGIKFTGEENENEHNRTFVLNKEERDNVETTGNHHLALPLKEDDSIERHLKTPDKHRRHWGNSIKGMDRMLIPSLQAFSLELRTTTEHVATRVRMLYEDWQEKYEGLEPSEIKISTKPIFPKTSPKISNDGGEQQGIAVVFRNLRKMEVKLKTIEQAAQAMVKALEDANTSKEMESKKTGLQRAKSFKWTELKNTARQTRSKAWLDEKEDRESSDLSSDSDT